MDTSIVVALISSGVALIGILVSAASTRASLKQDISNSITSIKKDLEHIEDKIKDLQKHVESHNNYARMFQENVPVLVEKVKVVNNRIADLENDIKELRK